MTRRERESIVATVPLGVQHIRAEAAQLPQPGAVAFFENRIRSIEEQAEHFVSDRTASHFPECLQAEINDALSVLRYAKTGYYRAFEATAAIVA